MAASASIYELSEDEVFQLAMLAIEAKERAYCPYSNFRVGASVLLAQPVDSNIYFTGSNVEVASTPVGICAERCALAPIVASVKRPDLPVVRGIAVSTDIWPPSSPCGMCRQFLREFCGLDTRVYMYGRRPDARYFNRKDEAREASVVMTVGQLLPLSFGPNDMNKRDVKNVGKIA